MKPCFKDAISGECSLVDQVMLFGQDERFLGAVVCVNPSALGAAGLIPKAREEPTHQNTHTHTERERERERKRKSF